MMAHPVSFHPIRYVIQRQYDDRYLLTKQFSKWKLESALSFYRKDLVAHYGCVNAIEFSNDGQLLVSGGDDRRVLVWRVDSAIHNPNFKPSPMRAQHISNIFCLGFDSTNHKIFSAGNDDQVIVHDASTGDPTQYYLHEQPVYGLSVDPLNDHIFASACDDGRILIFDIRESRSSHESVCLATYPSAFHGVMYNPVEPRFVATANSKEGVGLWDIRRPKREVIRYGGENAPQSCMSVRFNQLGTHILALRRRLPPILYHTESQQLCAQFDHPGYYNSCTMKSCSFAGAKDEFVLSGSDDFNLYMWKIPSTTKSGQWVAVAHMILKGHRSIVNQVRFNTANSIIASSGVEKLIKFWSPFQLPDSVGGPCDVVDTKADARKVYTHEEYITLVLQSGQFMSHDYSQESTEEDPRMMAFFDSLVQREIEGWSSEESVNSASSVQLNEGAAVQHEGYGRQAAQEGNDEEEVPVEELQELPNSTSDSGTSGPDDNDAATAFVEALQSKHNPEANKAKAAEAEAASNDNRITRLIAKKRAQLIRLAKAKFHADQVVASSSKRKMIACFGVTASSSSATSVNNEVPSGSSDDCSYQPDKATTSFKSKKSNGLNGVKRLPDTSSSDDDSTILKRKRRQRMVTSSSSTSPSSSSPSSPLSLSDKAFVAKENCSDSDEQCTSVSADVASVLKEVNSDSSDSDVDMASSTMSVPNHNALKLMGGSPNKESSLDEWDKPGLSYQTKKYSATPDSGIELSASRGNGSTPQQADSNDECDKVLPIFTKSRKTIFKRNYRNRITTSDSDTD